MGSVIRTRISYVLLLIGFLLIIWRLDIIPYQHFKDSDLKDQFRTYQQAFIGLGLLLLLLGWVGASYESIKHWSSTNRLLAWGAGVVGAIVLFAVLTPPLS